MLCMSVSVSQKKTIYRKKKWSPNKSNLVFCFNYNYSASRLLR